MKYPMSMPTMAMMGRTAFGRMWTSTIRQRFRPLARVAPAFLAHVGQVGQDLAMVAQRVRLRVL